VVGPAAHAGLDVVSLGGPTLAQACITHWAKGLSSRRMEA
jgi:hypothetical protein